MTMTIFVTGATGFVGAHTAQALLAAGHELRLLVRDEAAARRQFGSARGIERYVRADLCDAAGLRQAMAGCDAVFHAAAAVALDPRRAQQTYDNNVGGVRAVFSAAADLGIGKLVYVSSLSALFHPGLPRIDESTPLAEVREAYARSKRDADEHVRGLQAQGLPLQISYPSAVIGPDDPKFSEANRGLLAFISRMMPATTSGFQCVDVRDLAQAHRWLLERPVTGDAQDARYIVGGHFYPWAEFRQRLEQLLGRRLFSLPLPAVLMRALGAGVDALQRLKPFPTQITAEAMAFVTQWPPADSSRFLRSSGLGFRSGEETFADTIRWMVRAGHLPIKHAGRLLPA